MFCAGWVTPIGAVGTFLKALFGYNGNPSLLEVMAYSAYLVIVGILSLWGPAADPERE